MLIVVAVVAQALSCVQLFVTPWAVPLQVPLSRETFQARIPEWVVISFSMGSSQTNVSCIGRQILYH